MHLIELGKTLLEVMQMLRYSLKKKKKLTFITEPTDMTMYFLIAP